jgi:hypothetical protein
MPTALWFPVLLLGLATSCGGDDADPHGITTCSGWVDNQGNPFAGSCEAACAAKPASTGEQCDTVAKLGCAAFTFSGTDGCCIEENATIKFYECQ